jgi:dCMP deaminase
MKDKFIISHMRAAEVYADLSYAERRRVGCVVVKDDTIIAIGYNGTPPGWDNVCEDDWDKTKPEVIHAEQNALDKITRGTISSVGAYLFVTTAPCMECSKRIFGARIAQVFYRDLYRNEDGIEFLQKAGVPCERVQL